MICYKIRRFFSAFSCFLLFCFLLSALPAQESILSSYERNFIRASLTAKTRLLEDAAKDERAKEFIGNLYEFALQFALSSGQFLGNDPDMISLVAVAARGAGTSGNKDSVKTLWELFQIFSDSYSRVEILGALATLGTGNQELIGMLNRFLLGENDSFRKGGMNNTGIDFPVIKACIRVLGILGDNSSFPVLFSAMTAGYPQDIIQETLKALDSIQGNYKDYLINVIRNNPFPEKAAAFRIGAYNEKLKPSERGELAQAALEVSLGSNQGASLRYDAVTVLTRLKWLPAAPLAIRNFYQVQSDHSSALAPRERFLEAIAFLGIMESAEAAQALALQLGFLNSQTEKTGEYDEAIILALINALGELRDKAAFDYLLYIGYLDYPDRIQAAERDALNRLRW